MYAPEPFVLTDSKTIRETMDAYPLASFVTNGEDGPDVSHLPLIARKEEAGLVLYGHFARANPHWKALDGLSALAIFRGPQGYITPSWYATKQETGKVVPTWNYVTIHARGIPEILAKPAEARFVVDLLTDSMETARPAPWKVSDAPESFTVSMLRGIVAFRMPVSRLNATAKLSQNKSDADFAGARDGLSEDGATALSTAMQTL